MFENIVLEIHAVFLLEYPLKIECELRNHAQGILVKNHQNIGSRRQVANVRVVSN